MTSCAQYLAYKHRFKRLNMDDALKRFLRTSYWYKFMENVSFNKSMAFYDAIYKVDNEIFIKYIEGRLNLTEVDVVIPSVRYINEMKALQDMGFIICRVTHKSQPVNITRYAKTAVEGSVPVALEYDRSFAVRHNAQYSIDWTSQGSVGTIIEPFLERIGYKVDL